MFHCTLDEGQKTLDLCMQDGIVIYNYGRANQPSDLQLARRELDVLMDPWNNKGLWVLDEVTLYSGKFSYSVSYALSIEDGETPSEGRLTVRKDNEEVGFFSCDKGSVTETNYRPLVDAKAEAGEHYCWQDLTWGDGC